MTFKDCLDMGVDFMDIHSGVIYKIQEYSNAKKLGLPTSGIQVIDTLGNRVGVVEESFLDAYNKK